jgi:hypothetical protein
VLVRPTTFAFLDTGWRRKIGIGYRYWIPRRQTVAPRRLCTVAGFAIEWICNCVATNSDIFVFLKVRIPHSFYVLLAYERDLPSYFSYSVDHESSSGPLRAFPFACVLFMVAHQEIRCLFNLSTDFCPSSALPGLISTPPLQIALQPVVAERFSASSPTNAKSPPPRLDLQQPLQSPASSNTSMRNDSSALVVYSYRLWLSI